MVLVILCAASTWPSNHSEGTKNKTSNSSRIPILRRRSNSLSRPGSRCSRPPSRTDCQPAERPESTVPTLARKTDPNPVPGSRELRRNSESASGNRNRRGKSPDDDDDGETRKGSECAAASCTKNGGKNSRGRRKPDPETVSGDDAVGVGMTETSDVACRDRNQSGEDEAVRADDTVRPRSSLEVATDRHSVDVRQTPSRRERRSCSLDCSKSSNKTR